MNHFVIADHNSLVKVLASYCNNNLLILDVKQLNKIMKLYYFQTLKALWDGQGKIKMYYGISTVKKQLSGKRSILSWHKIYWALTLLNASACIYLHGFYSLWLSFIHLFIFYFFLFKIPFSAPFWFYAFIL